MSLEELKTKRRKWVEANRENGFEDGIKRLLTDLYPDNAHFIYELLQNAEDPRASVVRFTLSDTSVEFEHDGERLFSQKDVESITSIGTSTKRDDPTSIGKFGVGFKAVFAYTNTPEIHSGDFHFRIHDLVVPESDGVLHQKMGGRETRFVFPFDHLKKSRQQAVTETERSLRDLGDNTLLFLTHIRKIEYLLPDGSLGSLERIERDEGRIEIRASQPGCEETVSHWLRFHKDVGVEDEDGKSKSCRVAIAYSLVKEVAKKGQPLWKIVPLDRGQVSIYFPADKETSNLRFHIHAPFASTVARDSVRECQANDQLRDCLVKLAVESLTNIKNLGLLTVDFLAALPNPADNLSDFYEPIRAAIIGAMNEQPLTPTSTKSHAPAKYLLQAKASLKGLLSTDDIKFLVDYDDEPPQWAISAPQRNSNADRFLTGLKITNYDVEEFIDLLNEKADASRVEPDEDFMTWLAGKSIESHQQFYTVLYKELQSDEDWYRLENLNIVRLSNGCYSSGKECFFPSDGVEHDEVLPRVDKNVYSLGTSKAQQESAKNLLEKIGVRNVGEAEQVEAILKQRYGTDNFSPKKKDLQRFISLFEKEPDKAELFSDYFIFERKDGEWMKPSDIYLDEPFMDTGLSAYYDTYGDKAPCFRLADSYMDCVIDIERLRKFAEAVGARTRLAITETRCYSNPDWSYLSSVGGERETSPINRDYVISKIDILLAQPTLAISKLVWQTMCSLLHTKYLQARFRKTKAVGFHHAPSQLVHTLRAAAWIPQGDGTFACPAKASRNLLPEGFPFDPGWSWLKAIRFGEEAVKQSEVYRQKQTSAKELGFDSAEEAEKWKRVRDSGISPDEILAQQAQRQRTSQPEESVPDPVRRRKNILANTADAPDKESVQRERSVQVGISDVTAQAKAYLRTKYKNSEGQLVCQCCHEEMPFKLRSGEHYFEAVQYIEDKETRHFQNRLALCPTCAAMYQYARETDDAEIRRRIIELDADDQAPAVDIAVRLAGREYTLRFVGTHWFDLKTIQSGNDGV